MQDPLAKVLGAVVDGEIEYSYLECVKLAGHSCPTVSSSFLATKLALEYLYTEGLPVRGNIKVYMAGEKAEGVVGVMANVASFITGASDEAGFKGLAGKFARNNRISFSNTQKGFIAFERVDTGAKVEIGMDLSTLEAPVRMGSLMEKMMQQQASPAELEEFGILWQQKVRRLFDNAGQHIFIVS